MDRQTAICVAHTYHFADCFVKGWQEARKLLGVTLFEDCDAISEAYQDMVEELATEHLPEGWVTTFDYWGGRCFAYRPGWNAPKDHNTVMAGENGRYSCATSPTAIINELKSASEQLV